MSKTTHTLMENWGGYRARYCAGALAKPAYVDFLNELLTFVKKDIQANEAGMATYFDADGNTKLLKRITDELSNISNKQEAGITR